MGCPITTFTLSSFFLKDINNLNESFNWLFIIYNPQNSSEVQKINIVNQCQTWFFWKQVRTHRMSLCLIDGFLAAQQLVTFKLLSESDRPMDSIHTVCIFFFSFANLQFFIELSNASIGLGIRSNNVILLPCTMIVLKRIFTSSHCYSFFFLFSKISSFCLRIASGC